MTLKDISINKFNVIQELINSNHYTIEIDREIDILAEVYEKKEDYFLNLSLLKFKKFTEKLAFLKLENIQPAPLKYIKANGKIYAPIYDFTKLTAAQFIDITHFAQGKENFLLNLPKILASICVPTKLTLRGRKSLNYDSANHATISQNFEAANIYDAFAIAIFFCTILENFLKNYAGLFSKDEPKNEVSEDEDIQDEAPVIDVFTKLWGWHNTAENIAKVERVTIENVYNFNATRFLNSVAYLKAKAQHEENCNNQYKAKQNIK